MASVSVFGSAGEKDEAFLSVRFSEEKKIVATTSENGSVYLWRDSGKGILCKFLSELINFIKIFVVVDQPLKIGFNNLKLSTNQEYVI